MPRRATRVIAQTPINRRAGQRQYLLDAMRILGMTQEQLAHQLGLSSRSSISHLIAGRAALKDIHTWRIESLLAQKRAIPIITPATGPMEFIVSDGHARNMSPPEYFAHLQHCEHCLAVSYFMRAPRRISGIDLATGPDTSAIVAYPPAAPLEVVGAQADAMLTLRRNNAGRSRVRVAPSEPAEPSERGATARRGRRIRTPRAQPVEQIQVAAHGLNDEIERTASASLAATIAQRELGRAVQTIERHAPQQVRQEVVAHFGEID